MARTYHVLKQNEGPVRPGHVAYDYLAKIEASNPEQAIRLTAVDEGTGRYVAVPDGNWTSIGVRVEIPAPRVIFENEPQIGEAADEPREAIEVPLGEVGELTSDDHDGVEAEPLADDPEFQERKAELAARRAGQ